MTGKSRTATDQEVDTIVDRLYKTHTKSSSGDAGSQPRAEDVISRPAVPSEELDSIVQRLSSAHTVSSAGQTRQPRIATNSISREPASEDEMKQIYARLNGTHTKSSAGGQLCREMEPLKIPGFGNKTFPMVEGIETRFKGKEAAPEKVQEVIQKMHTTQTTASSARNQNPRHLLYPERTLLMNNVERIGAFQQNGSIVRQNVLQRTEKWFY